MKRPEFFIRPAFKVNSDCLINVNCLCTHEVYRHWLRHIEYF